MMTTIDKAAVGWTIAIVAIALIFAFYSSVHIMLKDDCPPGQTMFDGECRARSVDTYFDGEELDETLTMENVITMRVLRIDSLLNYLNTLPNFDGDAKDLSTKELGAIKSYIKSNSSLSAYNKMYQFREHFDGTGTDELVSDTQTRKNIYSLISDILLSQSKTLFLPNYNP